MRKCNRLPLLTCCLILLLKTTYGQSVKIDTGFQETALNNAKAHYYTAIGEQSALYNGPEYSLYNPILIRGSAYFQDQKTYVTGSVYYDGGEYKNIQLLYDLNKDELVTVLHNHYSNYILIKALVQNFDLMDQHFINIDADTMKNNSTIKTGYYGELYHGRSQILIKYAKSIQNTTSQTGSLEAYSYFTATVRELFIRKDNAYYKIGSEGSLLDVLKDKKKQLQQYIKDNKIKFRQNPGQAMVSITSYYDHLSN